MKSERELLQLLNAGNEESIRIIFDEFFDGLCLYAATLTRNFQVAEEVVEDVYIYIWLNSSSIKITSSLKSYLYKSVYHGCLKWLKSESRQTIRDDMNGISLFQSSQYIDPESDMIMHELEKKAESILEALPVQCRKIYILSRYENLSYAQIADKLKIRVGTVKTQMNRAYNRFRMDFGL